MLPFSFFQSLRFRTLHGKHPGVPHPFSSELRRKIGSTRFLARLLVAVKSFNVAASFGYSAETERSLLLTTASQVRALTEEQAHRELPAKLKGVFMGGADPEGIAFVIQDQTD